MTRRRHVKREPRGYVRRSATGELQRRLVIDVRFTRDELVEYVCWLIWVTEQCCEEDTSVVEEFSDREFWNAMKAEVADQGRLNFSDWGGGDKEVDQVIVSRARALVARVWPAHG